MPRLVFTPIDRDHYFADGSKELDLCEECKGSLHVTAKTTEKEAKDLGVPISRVVAIRDSPKGAFCVTCGLTISTP